MDLKEYFITQIYDMGYHEGYEQGSGNKELHPTFFIPSRTTLKSICRNYYNLHSDGEMTEKDWALIEGLGLYREEITKGEN